MPTIKLKTLLAKKEIYFHIVFWILYFATINVDWTENWFNRDLRTGSISQFSVILFPMFFYFNAFWLIPKFLKQRKWLKYIMFTSIIILILEGFRALIYSAFHPIEDNFFNSYLVEINSHDNIITGKLTPIFLCLQFSFAYRFTRDWILNNTLIDKLKTEKLQMELTFLKAQINPHFLFNNLNALDDLIDRDTKRAKTYLHKLSNMYRYVITTTDNDVVSLEEEWNFIDDYTYLLKERYGNAYQFLKTNELTNLQSYLIPPASIQSLIENAVKHNQGSIKSPMIITIAVNTEGITVSHLKNLKKHQSNTLGTGLKNLKTRFELLSNKEIKIEDSKKFIVSLPLINQLE